MGPGPGRRHRRQIAVRGRCGDRPTGHGLFGQAQGTAGLQVAHQHQVGAGGVEHDRVQGPQSGGVDPPQSGGGRDRGGVRVAAEQPPPQGLAGHDFGLAEGDHRLVGGPVAVRLDLVRRVAGATEDLDEQPEELLQVLGQDGPAHDDPVFAHVGVEAAAQVLDGPGQRHPVVAVGPGEQGPGKDAHGRGLADLLDAQGDG